MLHPEIKILGEQCLKEKAYRVIDITPEVLALIDNMYKVMKESGGIGLAANQVGSNLSIFVTNIRNRDEVFINPEIIEKEEQIFFNEGCLSVPGVADQTKRFRLVVLTYQTPEDMNYTIREEFEDTPAVVVQHEVDHLNGKLYIDSFNAMRKSQAIKKCKKTLSMLDRRNDD